MERNAVTLAKIIILSLIVSASLSACGQRVYPADPAGRVHDSHSY